MLATYRHAPVTRQGHLVTAVGQALPLGALAAYAAGDMDRTRLDVQTPDAGLIDTCTAPATTVRGACVLPKIDS